MAAILRNYDEVITALGALPPPKEGLVRVYRGQTRDHEEKMVPSGLRQKIHRRGVWKLYAMGIAEDLRRQANPDRNLSTADIYEWLIWVEAIAQHYGPGSEFLDVTRSRPIALWFALHRYEPFDIKSIMGPAGPPNSDEDVPVEGVGVRYVPYTEDAGWLYVFDVPEFGESLKHGMLFDLQKTPEVFASCPRIHTQEACLLWADRRINGGDLASLYACKPLRVSWPLSGTPNLNKPTDEMFPLPSRDPWYARFVSIPCMLTVKDDGSSCCFTQPLEVRAYVPNEKPERAGQEFFEREIILAPHLFYRAVLMDHTDPPEGGWVIKWESGHRTCLADATAIYLEAPLLFARPPITSGLWNEGLLATDSDATTAAVELTRGKTRNVTLENVFVEFSPLEKVGWERIEHSKTESMEMLRGVWFARDGNMFTLQLFLQRFPSPRVSSFISGFMEYDAATRKFRFRDGSKLAANVFDLELATAYQQVKFEGINKDDVEAKTAFEYARRRILVGDALATVLTLLRDLSTNWKTSPYPLGLVRAGRRTRAMIRIAPQVCRLATCDGSAGYYFVRDVVRDEPYTGPGLVQQIELREPDEKMERTLAKAIGGTCMGIELTGQFADVQAESLRSAIVAAVKKRASA